MSMPVALFLFLTAVVILFQLALALGVPSKGERLLWGPVNVIMLIAAVLAALM